MRRWIAGAVVALALLAIGGFAWLWVAPCALGGCAPVHDLERFQAEGSELLDIRGEPFGTLATVNRKVVALDSLPAHLPQAFLAVEDQRFYDHSGLDFQRMVGALLANLRAGGIEEGGSTVTMQLARNLFPEHLPYTERSVRRKLMEIRVARQIERAFPKNKIFELYLNHIYLGAGAYGVEAAAQTYFGKPAAELTLAEAALLGGLPKAPSTLDPTRNQEGALERRNLVLTAMAEAGYVSGAEAAAARREPIRLAQTNTDPADGSNRSYFIERVREELREHVGDRFYTAGLRVYTTLDPGVQRAAEQELVRQLDAIEGGRFGPFPHPRYQDSGELDEKAGRTPYLQGAVVMMDAQGGEVRALVGGRDFGDSKFDRATQALRQPGSAFKPFVYLTALQHYYSPIHQVKDAPLSVPLSGGKVWEPKNYTGRYDGMLTLREALMRSKNIPTVRLAQEVGVGAVIRNARQLGITSDIPDVPSAALGAADVRPVELAAAYAPFANGGMRTRPHFIRRVEDRHGRVLWKAPRTRESVLDPAVAFVMTSMLRDVVDRGTGRAVRTAGFFGPAAGKTGTTNGATDVWFVGYTPELVAAVWMGFDDPQTIVHGASGGTLAAPVWGRIMREAYADRSLPPAWQPPAGIISEEVDRASGLVVDESCPARSETYTEFFVNTRPPHQNCVSDRNTVFVYSDSSWIDEEWGRQGDTLYGTGEVTEIERRGIYWPELEKMRDRDNLTRSRISSPEPAHIVPLPSPISPPPPPDLLGTPVVDDSAAHIPRQ